MKINITPPKYYSVFYLRHKTRIYMKGVYNKTKAWTVFEGKQKGYYLYISKRNIQIELINTEKDIITDIEKYLEFLFYKQYIGISTEHAGNIQLKAKNVKCLYLQ